MDADPAVELPAGPAAAADPAQQPDQADAPNAGAALGADVMKHTTVQEFVAGLANGLYGTTLTPKERKELRMTPHASFMKEPVPEVNKALETVMSSVGKPEDSAARKKADAALALRQQHHREVLVPILGAMAAVADDDRDLAAEYVAAAAQLVVDDLAVLTGDRRKIAAAPLGMTEFAAKAAPAHGGGPLFPEAMLTQALKEHNELRVAATQLMASQGTSARPPQNSAFRGGRGRGAHGQSPYARMPQQQQRQQQQPQQQGGGFQGNFRGGGHGQPRGGGRGGGP